MSKQDSLVIHEIYTSIQGESSFAGLPCTFVRTTGCNLRCSWCDTTHSFYGGTRLTRKEVFERVVAHQINLILLTGGEPLLQPASLPLMRDLSDAGFTVLLETSGERDLSLVDSRVHKIMDFKTPSSGECHRHRDANLNFIGARDELKFVLKDRADYEWMKHKITSLSLHKKTRHLLASTVFGCLSPRTLVNWILEDKLPIRVQLQLHKYIWPPDTQAV